MSAQQATAEQKDRITIYAPTRLSEWLQSIGDSTGLTRNQGALANLLMVMDSEATEVQKGNGSRQPIAQATRADNEAC